jgi:ubiquinone/menaquinone biosynthesis C-methylase UbiE
MDDKKPIQDWWADNPMTYGSEHGRADYDDRHYEIGSREFFDRLDQEFYSWNTPLHQDRPFDRIFNYTKFGEEARVLEIGCGLGTMAMNWALSGAAVTAVDLNPTSITQTRKRFELYGLTGEILAMDANNLEFPDATFDYVYSWGVLHHSPNLEKSLAEMMRVLKPDGEFGLMLYNRRSILYRYLIQYLEGFLHYENRFLGPLELASRYTDGALQEGNPHTWPVTKNEIQHLLAPFCRNVSVRLLGTDLDYSFKFLLPILGAWLPRWAKKPWARRFGWSLWATGSKS